MGGCAMAFNVPDFSKFMNWKRGFGLYFIGSQSWQSDPAYLCASVVPSSKLCPFSCHERTGGYILHSPAQSPFEYCQGKLS